MDLVEDFQKEESDDYEFISETNPDEVRAIIQSFKLRKAVSPYQIPSKALGKIADRVIWKRLAKVLNELADEQFGFRPHRSTSEQLLRVIEFVAKSTE
ncbi:hypothetical protein Zmor_014413 [Zophobas morio]|uniref:Uncharacterized protein n=1 Tax=Zophobas morio TaxID=2755281 RepID=A0AA38IEM2_9CUCU|nr:hypothetical protein Zmor_014413 [Zophobas morio]